MKATERATAAAKAGYRELYAMKNGKETKRTENGETLYIFTYSEKDPYQDANGATWNATRKTWIN